MASNCCSPRLILGVKVLFGLVYAPIGAEVALRLIAPVPMLPRYVCATAYGIRGNMPNRTYWHQSAEFKVQLHTNSKGIRSDREIPYERTQGIKRIVLLGDSFGMGYEVSYEDMFTSRMTYHLEHDHGIKAEVVNLSTSGHGNAEELIVLQNEGLKYQPDLVLLAWHVTDYDDNVRSNLYSLTDGRLVRKAQTYLPGVEAQEKLYRLPLYALVADNSNLYNLLRDWAGGTVKSLLLKARSLSSKQGPSETPPDPNYSTDLMIALLSKIRGICEQRGIAFMILDIPVRVSRSEFVSEFPSLGPGMEHPLDVVSPISKFAEANGRRVYTERSHGHFTPFGCDMVGKVLADHIADRGLLYPNVASRP